MLIEYLYRKSIDARGGGGGGEIFTRLVDPEDAIFGSKQHDVNVLNG